MYSLAQAAAPKYHRLGGFNNKFISPNSGGSEVQDQDLGRVGFILRSLFLAYRWLPCDCVLTWLLNVAQREGEEEWGSRGSVITEA